MHEIVEIGCIRIVVAYEESYLCSALAQLVQHQEGYVVSKNLTQQSQRFSWRPLWPNLTWQNVS